MAPVAIGTAIAIGDERAHGLAAAAALLGAVWIQIGTNFANDYFDFRNGTDTEDRIGPTRATAAGWVTPARMRTAYLVAFGLAAAFGAYLIWRAGWPLVWVGISSIAFGILYTGGPRPLGYVGLGDVLVLVYFGPVAVGFTYFVQALEWSWVAAFVGLTPGCLSTALLAVNNLRDHVTDAQTGKRTLAVRFGPRFAKLEFVGCLVVAAATPVVCWATGVAPWPVLFAALTVATTWPAARSVLAARPGDRLLPALAATGRTLALFGISLSLLWGLFG